MTPRVRHSNKIIAATLRGDLYSFVQAAFPIVAAEQKLLRNWHIEAMTYALTRVLRGEIKRLIITVPPRNLKSICASVALPAFALGHDPTRKFICVSYAQGLAEKHANDCRALMQSRDVPARISNPDQSHQRHPTRVRHNGRRLSIHNVSGGHVDGSWRQLHRPG